MAGNSHPYRRPSRSMAKLPLTVGTTSDFAKAGALVSYGPNYPDLFRRAAEIVDKILRGDKAGRHPGRTADQVRSG